MGNGRIAIIGANQGALAFACFAAESGFTVSMYEAKKQEDVGYDWTDDLLAATFEKLGIKRPPEVITGKKPAATLVSPNRQSRITIPDPPKETDIPVERKELNKLLYERAVSAGVSVNYECPVKSVICNNKSVSGIILADGTSIRADLVADCGGCESAGRMSLPKELNIPRKINPDDMFFVRRTFFERPAGSEAPEYLRPIYIKHLNERGISWCWLSLDGKCADVLIGRLGKLSNETYEKALEDLRKEYPIIGERIVKGGQPLKIPVRHAISRMVANGYALIGDSAYMTIPMIGSGMANSLNAAKMLADVISEPIGEPFSISNLYRYQKRYMKEIGAGQACIELLKTYFLNSRDGEIDFLLSDSIVSDSLLQGTSGEFGEISAAEIAKSVFNCMKRPDVLGRLTKIVIKIGLLSRTAENLPDTYDENALCAWQNKYDSAFINN